MTDGNVQSLNDRLIADSDLRDRFRRDPAGVVREAGIELSADQEARLTAESWLEKEEEELLAILRDSGLFFWF